MAKCMSIDAPTHESMVKGVTARTCCKEAHAPLQLLKTRPRPEPAGGGGRHDGDPAQQHGPLDRPCGAADQRDPGGALGAVGPWRGEERRQDRPGQGPRPLRGAHDRHGGRRGAGAGDDPGGAQSFTRRVWQRGPRFGSDFSANALFAYSLEPLALSSTAGGSESRCL